jgi:hypothetical protein
MTWRRSGGCPGTGLFGRNCRAVPNDDAAVRKRCAARLRAPPSADRERGKPGFVEPERTSRSVKEPMTVMRELQALIGGIAIGVVLTLLVRRHQTPHPPPPAPQPLDRPKDRTGAIIIENDGEKTRVKYATKYFVIGRNKRKTIEWNIYNVSSGGAEIELRNFRRRTIAHQGSGTVTNPFKHDEQSFRATVGPNCGSASISAEHKDIPEIDGEWCYELWVNGREEDPDIRIDPWE